MCVESNNAYLISPKVSIIMAAYNATPYLRQAVDSILCQTFTDFEFVIIDDGSQDQTADIIKSYSDPRIVLIENETNIGLTRSLNRGISASSGDLLARQDADDLSMPNRLELQVKYLDDHPKVGLIGSSANWVNEKGDLIQVWQPLNDPDAIQRTLLSRIPFRHGTFMFRRSCLADIGGGYDESMPVAQDCDLLLRISEHWDVTNLEEVLYNFRIHSDTVTVRHGDDQVRYLSMAQEAAINRRLKYAPGRIGLTKVTIPRWVENADRQWFSKRYVWWSSGARAVSRKLAAKYLLYALLLNPTTPEIWEFLGGIIYRKMHKLARHLFKPSSIRNHS